MRKTTFLFTLLFSWIVIFNSNAQFVDNDKTSYKKTCELLNSNKITTGFLSNQTWPLSTIPLLRGLEQDTIDASTFRQLFFDLQNARVEGSKFPSIEHLRNQLRVNTIYKIPLGLIYQNYNYIKENAIEDGLLLFENDRFWDGPNNSESPYESEQTFAASALKTGSHFSKGTPIVYELSDNLIFNNSGNTIKRYEIDFDDGNGYQKIFPNKEISIYYFSEGEKILRFRTYTETDTLYSHSRVELIETHISSTEGNNTLSPNGGGGVCPPDHIEVFSTQALPLGCSGSASWTAFANAYIRYADPDNPQLTKPIIFVEGLDLGTEITEIRTDVPGEHATIRSGDFGWDVFTTGVNPENPNPAFANLPNLLEDFSSNDYDIILLDFEQGAASIQQNADLLIQLINWVNEEKVGCEQNVVIGASMGGQIVRYALASMEGAEEDHDTRLYASIDSPHKGANIPPGLQGAIKFFSPLLEDANLAFNNLQLPAVKQLLLYHISEDICLREKYVGELAGLGYPDRCRNVAVVSGSNAGSAGGQGFNAGDKLLEFNLQVIGVLLLQGFMDVDLDIWALQNESFGNNQKVFEVDADGFFTRFPLPVAITVDVHDELSVDPSSLGPLDNTPGGNRSTIGDEIAPGLQLSFLTSLPGLLVQGLAGVFVPNNLTFQEKHSFIPSISALDVNTNDLFFDIAINIDPDDSGSLTPFDAYFSQPENLGHVEISSNVISWVVETELPKSRPNLPNPLNETYNYGLIINKIPEVTINSSGILRINDMGPTGLLNEDPSNKEFFTAYTQSNCESNVITVSSGGQFILGSDQGDPIFRKAKVHVVDESVVDIESGGIMYVGQQSKLIIEEGAKVEVEGRLNAVFGAKVNVEKGGILHIKSGGILRVMHWSDVIVKEGGQLIIDDGAIIQLWDGDPSEDGNANIQIYGELVLNGQFEFGGSGFFTFHDSHKLTFAEGIDEFVLNGRGKGVRFIRINGTQLDFGGRTLRLSNGKVEYTGSGVSSIVVGEEGEVLIQNMEFRSNSNEQFYSNALTTLGTDRVNISNCDFYDLERAIYSNGINNPTGTYTLSNCTINNCQYGAWIWGMNTYNFFNVDFNAGPESYRAIWGVGVNNCYVSHGKINNYNSSNAAGAVILDNVTNFQVRYGELSNNTVGILVPDGSQSNVFLNRGTRIIGNGIGVDMVKGGLNGTSGNDYGLVHVDCARFIDNGMAIQGEDVLLEIDAIENCLGCPSYNSRPNQFEGEDLFSICYQDRDITEISAQRNYWGEDINGPFPSQFRLHNGLCNSSFNSVTLDASDPELNEPLGNCSGGQSIGGNIPPIKICVLTMGSTNYLLHQQFMDAYEEFRRDSLDLSRSRYMPIAAIPDQIRSQASVVCKQYIDVARVMTNVKSNPRSNTAGTRSWEDFAHLWIPDAIAPNSSVNSSATFTVYPNPASTDVVLDLDYGEQEVRFINSLGRIYHKAVGNGKTVVNVEDWPNGLYLIESINGTTKQRQTARMIIQH